MYETFFCRFSLYFTTTAFWVSFCKNQPQLEWNFWEIFINYDKMFIIIIPRVILLKMKFLTQSLEYISKDCPN